MKALVAASLALLAAPAWAQTLTVEKMSAALLRYERDSADEYARVSKLATLSESSRDEVRIWPTWATFDPSTNGIATVGYIVTDREWQLCRIAYKGQSTAAESGVCKRQAARASPEQIRAHLRRLTELADSSIECGISDGEWLTIDAVSNGKRFTVAAGNPGACPGNAARVVSRFLSSVRTPQRL